MRGMLFKIVYVVIILLILVFGLRSAFQKDNAAKDIAKEAVVLSEAKILEENEGKLVIVAGELESDDILKFDDFAVEVKTPILERKVEMLQYVKDGPESGVTQKWSEDEPDPTVIDSQTGKSYYNKVKALKNETIYGNGKVGEFEIGPEVLQVMKTNENYTDLKDLKGYRVINKRQLTNSSTFAEIPGDYRIAFRYLNLDKNKNYTFVGQQVKNTLTEYKSDSGLSVLESYEGKLNLNDVIKQMQKKRNVQILTTLGFVGLFTAIGIALLKMPKNIMVKKDDEVKEKVDVVDKEE